MKIRTWLPIVSVALAWTLHAAPFYANGPREEINLAGPEWQMGIADTLDVGRLPDGLAWKATAVPRRAEDSGMKSADHQWQYCDIRPETMVNADGTFKVKEKLSTWYRRTVDIPQELLKEHTVHLCLAGAAYRSGIIVNGRAAGESIQAALPLEFDITAFVRPGLNELAIAITPREGIVDPKAKVYLAPSNGVVPGIRGPLRLEFRPLITVDDVFVKTSVQKKSIAFQTTLVNRGKAATTVVPRVAVRSYRDPKQVLAIFAGDAVVAAPGTETVTTLSANWVAPILWSLSTPELYVAEVTLWTGETLLDRYEQSFGFREFTVKGKDFQLNGERIVLLRESSLEALKTLENRPDEVAITQKPSPINCIRTHLGTYNADLLRRASIGGILVMPESAFSWVHIYPHTPEAIKVWLPGVLDYYKRWARLLRNEPSVVVYSLVNETYWDRNLPEEMNVARQIVELMRREDPTRPLQGDGESSWNGLLDVINIHYPEGTAGTLRLKHPNAGTTIPNDLEWLTAEGGVGWRSGFKWDRPLFLGEFGASVEADSWSAYAGDTFYDWIRWRQNTRSGIDQGGGDKERGNPFYDSFRKMINYYRHMGVAGLNLWAGDRNAMLKAQVIAPLDFHPNVEAGGTFTRKLAVFNDGKVQVQKIKYYLTVNGTLVCDAVKPFWVGPGQKWAGDISIPVPNVAQPAKGQFTARLLYTRGTEDIEVDRHTETIYILPRPNLEKLVPDVAMVDPDGALKTLLAGIHMESTEAATGTVPKGKKLLVVGVNAFNAGLQPMLDAFVEGGGVVLMLPQKEWRPYRVELPERDPQHAATQSWIRMSGHPAFRGMEEPQFSFWNDDNVISYETFKKPAQGPLQALLDAGGRFGLRWSPLLEVPVGKGAFLMTTLELGKPDPAARQLLANLVEYGCTRQPAPRRALNLLAGKNSLLTDALQLAGVEHTAGLGTAGAVLIDGTAEFELAAVKGALAAGRTVWLHNFTPESYPRIAPLMPPGSSLVPVPPELIGVMPVGTDGLTRGLAAFDFAWYIPELYYPGPLFDRAAVVAKTGDWVLNTNLFGSGIKPLTDPAFMVRLDTGGGTVLFDTLQWENAVGKTADKALRVVAGLADNLGCELSFGNKINYDRTFVNLAPFANMGYLDRQADDGVGGWTDQGRNDMRFFLINHSGKGNGEEDGMDVPVPPFPTDVDFDGVQYRLVDPRANGNKAVLSFGSAEHAPKLMRAAGPIPVGARADIIWFLHALAWAEGKSGGVAAEYDVLYEDGTRTTIPIRRSVECGDWFGPTYCPNGMVAWTGKNLVFQPVGLYSSTWQNPHPDKIIRSVSIRAGLDKSQYVLVAMTCGVVGKNNGKVVADIDFTKPSAEAGLFFNSTPPPMQTPDGLICAHGSCTTLDAKQAGLRDFARKPFRLAFDITASDKPDGYCAGLVETGAFRITLMQGAMTVTVETVGFDGKPLYISSHGPVELNRRVKFEYEADGKRGILRRDGKIDTIVEAPLPNRDIDQIRFGVAGGKAYNFNGTFHRVTFMSGRRAE